jgi:hypothetical protein
VSPTLAAAIDAARDLAWRPTANLPGSLAYTERKESADRLCALICRLRVPGGAPDELRYLVAAMRRVAGCSFSNRRGEPYYARRRAIYELRGCLDVWQRSENDPAPPLSTAQEVVGSELILRPVTGSAQAITVSAGNGVVA